MTNEIEQGTRRLLQYVVVPLWIGAGVADWICHRRTRIERTAGLKESAIHALMMAEAGVPATAGLFLEVNAGLLALTLGAFTLHQLTALWDVAYADGRRRVTPTEQHIHGLLEQVPAMATTFLMALHWDETKALFGGGRKRPTYRLERKRRPLPRSYQFGFLGSVIGLVALPYAEEIWRCQKAARAVASSDAIAVETSRG